MSNERKTRAMIRNPWDIKIHMVGIGGAGMSALALFLNERGANISGSDRSGCATLDNLRARGITAFTPLEEGGALPFKPDLVIHTAAIDGSNPELAWALENGVEIIKYASMLGRIMESYQGIAVAGTHGKTSVSAMTAFLLKTCGLAPSFVIGGFIPDLGGGGGCNDGDHFIVEACEFDRSFLQLNPKLAVITNLEADHLDYYGSFEQLVGAFEEFVSALAQRGGTLIISDEAAEIVRPERFPGLELFTYGFQPESDLVIDDFDHGAGCALFRLSLQGRDLGRFVQHQPGRHNVLNGAASILMGLRLGIDQEKLRAALPTYRGVNRRLEELGTFGGVRMFTDYAHHPTEIRAVLDTLRKVYPGSRLVVAYQAHQKWRTGFFLSDFGKVLAEFDLTLLLKTFSVRESDTEHLPGGKALKETVTRCGGKALYVGDLEDASQAMLPHLRQGDLLVLMGAGNIDEISDKVEHALSGK